jgi:hypothetical protein
VLGISLGLVAAGGPQASADPAGASCSASYATVFETTNGNVFQGDVTVTSTGTTALAGWTVTFTFGGNQSVSSLWNAYWTAQWPVGQETITASNASYNGIVWRGAATSFGLLGQFSSSDAPPASLTCTATPVQVSLTGPWYVTDGYNGTFTATANVNVGPTPYYIEIWDATTGTELEICGSGTTCSATYTTSGDETTHQIVAFVSADSATIPLGTAQATSNTVGVFNDGYNGL